MQAVGAALPELDAARLQAVPAPVLGPWRLLAGEPLGDLTQQTFQLAAVGQRLTLRGAQAPSWLAAGRSRK